VEIGEKLANKLGISHGDTVKVSSNRSYGKAKAVVTKRIRTLKANGQDIDTIGIPIHWGYEGVAKKALSLTLTPFVGDANTQTPEFKSFLVNVERCNGDDLAYQSQDIIRRSATNGFTPAPQARDHQEEVAKLIDVTTCIGCKACRWPVLNGTTSVMKWATTLGCTTTR
jgi:predicted molibdopterin-dependent oxidoreductase YjgC